MNKQPKLFTSSPVSWNGRTVEPVITAADDRLRCVQRCDDIASLQEALQAPHLQKTVRQAIERRIRKLEAAHV